MKLKYFFLSLVAAIALSATAYAQESAISGGGGSMSTAPGSGTPNRVVRFVTSSTIGDGLLSDDATNLTLTSGRFLVGATGPSLKNSSGTLQIRNAGDSAFAPFSGSTLILNGSTSGAATIAAAGTTTPYTLTLPSAVPGSNGQPILSSTGGALSYPTGTPDGSKFLRDDGTWQVPAGGGGGAPVNAQYLVSSADGTLSAERVTTDTATIAWDAATAAQIKANVVDGSITLPKLVTIATDRLLGRDTAGTGAPELLTVGGGIEFSGSGGIQRSALTGDVTASAGSNSTTIANNAVTLPQLADIATARFLGRVTASTGDPEALTGTQATTLLDPFTSSLKGLAPASGGGTTNFLRADGTWAAPSGSGLALVSEATSPNRVTVNGKLRLGNDQATTSSFESGGGIVNLINYGVPTGASVAFLGQYNLVTVSTSGGARSAITEGLRSRVYASGSNNITGAVKGFQSEIENDATGSLGSVYGAYFSVLNNASSGTTLVVGNVVDMSNASSGTTAALVGSDTVIATSAGTVSLAIGSRLKAPTGAGTVTAYRALALGAPGGTPNAFYTYITPGVNTADLVLTTPTAPPANSASPLLVSTAGVMSYPTGTPNGSKFLRDDGSWQVPSGGGSPGGSDTYVQFNDGGAFGGVSGLALNKTAVALTLTGGTIAGDNSQHWLGITGTMPTTLSAATAGVEWVITGAGSSNQTNRAFNLDYAAGYTGANLSVALRTRNLNAGTGNSLARSSLVGNLGMNAQATGTTTGLNVGQVAVADNGDLSVGLAGLAQTNKNSATNVGVYGGALNGGTSPVQVAGAFFLTASAPSLTSAALLADNVATTSPIAVFRDNGSAVWSILDGGELRPSNNAVDIGSASNRVRSLYTNALRIGYAEITNAASPYSVTASDYVIAVDASSGAVTVNLQAAATAGAGRPISVIKTDSSGNTVTIDGNSTETINGATTVVLSAQYSSAGIVSNGVDTWRRFQ